MKPKYIYIRNYKAFGDKERKIELRPITLIIGKNSSGKSSLLKLISILSTLSKGKVEVPMVMRNDDVCLGGGYADLFHNNEQMFLCLGLENDKGQSVKVEYMRNIGRIYAQSFTYTDANGNECKMASKASGLPMCGIVYPPSEETAGYKGEDFEFDVDYIGPMRQQPKRNVAVDHFMTSRVGNEGQNAVNLLLQSYLGDKELYNNVSEWMDINLEGHRLRFDRNSESSSSYSLYVNHGRAKVNIADVGQGVSQILPIVVASYMPQLASTIAIEQPGLHLHPAAHQPIGRRLADSALEYGRTYVIESHSENLLLSLREMITNKDHPLQADDVVIYYIGQDADEATIKRITIDADGELSDWPYGIYGEAFELMCKIRDNVEL